MYCSSLYIFLFILNELFKMENHFRMGINPNNNNNNNYYLSFLDIFLKNHENANKTIYEKLVSLLVLIKEVKDFTTDNFKLIFFPSEVPALKDSEEKEENIIVVKPETKYENKYLEKIRAIPDEYIFTEEEKLRQETLFIEFLDNAKKDLNNTIEKLKKELTNCQQELSDIENIEFSEEDKKSKYDEMEGHIDSFEDRIKEKKRAYIEDVERIKEELIVLNEKEICEEEIRETVINHIINEKLDTLQNNFVIEKTPLGNVLMFYNNKKQTFEYYSDNSIPYRFLEVVSRKYVLTFHCRFLYVDMEEELKKCEKKIAEQELKNKELKDKELRERENTNVDIDVKDTKTPKKNVFAKFKSYNKDAGSGRVNKAPPPKNSIPSNKLNKTENENVLLKEKSNHYTCEGKFANFNILKKVDRKVIDKKYSMSFADFKKSVINKK